MLIIDKFKINIDKVKKRNEELINKKWIDKLSTKQKKFLDWRKGPPKNMNKDGLFSYFDLSNYLVNQNDFNKININHLVQYLTIYDIQQRINMNTITDDLKIILQKIQKNRINAIRKYISIEDSIFKIGIYSRDVIYRMQTKPIDSNIIKNSTSWGLVPIEWFCEDTICHLYITKIPSKLKVIYLENNSKDKNLNTFQNFNMYEFEYILPRNIEFVEIKTKNIKILNIHFANKDNKINTPKERTVICHWIRITKQIKLDFPKIYDVCLTTHL